MPTPNEQRQMLNAIKLARQNFRYFAREQMWDSQRPESSCPFAAVLCSFTDSFNGVDIVEKLWLAQVYTDGNFVQGQLITQPEEMLEMQVGEWYQVPLKEIDDWAYVLEGKVYGAYTVNLLRSRMPEHERRLHDKKWGYEFGDPKIVDAYPRAEQPEEVAPEDEPPPTKFFGMTISKKKSKKEDPLADVNQRLDHPLAIQMERSFREYYQANPEVINAVNEKGWTLLHVNALAGNRNIVKLLLEFGADPHAATPGHRTAKDMAKSMGWPEVVTILSAAERGSVAAPIENSN